MHEVAALFVRHNSVYKTMAGVDAWDEKRDGRKWPGGTPLVAHPPCAQWGCLSHLAHKKPSEKRLALLAVKLVRKYGGVLEHPLRSKLWAVAGLPAPGAPADRFGGWTLPIYQNWFGHRAEKRTLLYIVGMRPAEMPSLPIKLGESEAKFQRATKPAAGQPFKPGLTDAEREHTPPALAAWLVEVARRCSSRAKEVTK